MSSSWCFAVSFRVFTLFVSCRGNGHMFEPEIAVAELGPLKGFGEEDSRATFVPSLSDRHRQQPQLVAADLGPLKGFGEEGNRATFVLSPSDTGRQQPQIVAADLGPLKGFGEKGNRATFVLSPSDTGRQQPQIVAADLGALHGFHDEGSRATFVPSPSDTDTDRQQPQIVAADLGALHGFNAGVGIGNMTQAAQMLDRTDQSGIGDEQASESLQMIPSPAVKIQHGSGLAPGSVPSLSKTHPSAMKLMTIFGEPEDASIFDVVRTLRIRVTGVFMLLVAFFFWKRRRNLSAKGGFWTDVEYGEEDLI